MQPTGQAPFQGLKAEHHDGRLWLRLASFFAELKAGRKINVLCLRNPDCNLQHKPDELIRLGHTIEIKKEKKKLGIHVRLNDHRKCCWGRSLNIALRKKTVELEVPMPSAKAPYIVVVGLDPVVRGTPLIIRSDAGVSAGYYLRWKCLRLFRKGWPFLWLIRKVIRFKKGVLQVGNI